MVTQVPVRFPREAFYPQVNNVSFRSAPPATTNLELPLETALYGKLSKNKKIVDHFPITIYLDEGEYVVSEPIFHIHGAGDTLDEAISSFARIVSEIYDDLVEERDHLGKRMKEQLEYLQTKIEVLG